jgi:hypothetical protein
MKIEKGEENDPWINRLPEETDADIPPDVRRGLMRCATANGRISYWFLCDIYRQGVAQTRQQHTAQLAEKDETCRKQIRALHETIDRQAETIREEMRLRLEGEAQLAALRDAARPLVALVHDDGVDAPHPWWISRLTALAKAYRQKRFVKNWQTPSKDTGDTQ